MRIEELVLKPFGCFSDLVLELEQDKSFHLFYGPNEAGKSTLLRALTGLFYGIPGNTPDAHSYLPGKLRVGVLVEDGNGEEKNFVRRKGNKDTLLDQNGQTLADREMDRLLNGVSKEIFSTMFGLNHADLQRGGQSLLENGGAVGESLFAAATGMTDLKDILTDLEKRASDLFTPRKTTSPLKKALNRYAELRKESRQESLEARQWVEQERQYHKTEQELQQLKERIVALNRNRNQLERIQRSMPLIARRRNLSNELEQLSGTLILNEDVIKKENLLVQTAESNRKEMKRAGTGIQKIQETLGTLKIPSELLEQAEGINELSQRLNSYRSWKNELPILQGKLEQLEQESLNGLREILPGAESLIQLEPLRLDQDTKILARALGNEYLSLKPELIHANDEAENLQSLLRANEEEINKIGQVTDTAELMHTLAVIRREGKLEEQLLEKRREIKGMRESLAQGVKCLGFFSGSPSDLPLFPVPLAETLKDFQQRFYALETSQKEWKQQRSHFHEELQRLTRELQEIALGRRIPTEDELQTIRARREKGWQLIRLVWLEGEDPAEAYQSFDPDYPLHEAYEKTVHEADEVADQMRWEAASVGKQQALLQAVENCRGKAQEAEENLQGVGERLIQTQQNWENLWKPMAIVPLSPLEMLEWRDDYFKLIQEMEQLKKTEHSLEELEEQIQQMKDRLILLLEPMGVQQIEENESLAEIMEKAEDLCTEIDTVRQSSEQLKRDQLQLQKRYQGTLDEKEKAERKVKAWTKEWEGLLQSMHLPQNSRPEVVLARIEKLEQVFHGFEQTVLLNTQIEQISQQCSLFATDTDRLLEMLPEVSRGIPKDRSVLELKTKLDRAREDSVRQNTLREQMKQEEENLNDAGAALAEAMKEIENILTQNLCKNQAEFETAVGRSRLYLDRQRKREEIDEQLENGGEGLSLQEILQEAGEAQADLLAARLEDLQQTLKETKAKHDEVWENYVLMRNAYDEKVQGNASEAADAETEAQSTLAEIQTLSGEYMRFKLSAVILRCAIEQYREKNQGQLISRAGELLCAVTAGSFAGLKVDYDEKDRPVLTGIRCNGQEVGIEGMSDGTQDQLYLALRIAALEQYLEEGEPIPFIVDDILINFDELRSKETLKILAELSKRTQIVFFTHHRRLVDLAKESIPASYLAVYELGALE